MRPRLPTRPASTAPASEPLRRRSWHALFAVATMALGLASRYAPALPSFIAAYAGDALWAAMVFWIAALLFSRAKTITLASAALGVSLTVELSQLYHAPWIDDIRATRL